MIEFITRRYFAFFTHSCIRQSLALFWGYLFAVIAVFFYCNVECSFASYEKPELCGGTFNFGYGVGESLENSPVPMLSNRVKSFQLSKNPASESNSGLVKFFDSPVLFASTFGEKVVNDFHCKCSHYGTGSESDGWVKGYHANSLLLGFFIGGWVAIFVYDIIPLILRLF
jgi:hypothetical protein